MSDRLALASAIEDAGIERSTAQRVASAIFDATHDNVATKADVAELRHDLQATEFTEPDGPETYCVDDDGLYFGPGGGAWR